MKEQQVNDNLRIEDSLDNLSNLKLRQSSLQKHRTELIQVKNKFVSFLEKLQSSETRQISLSQIKKLIQKNNEPDHLRIYLSILKTLKPNHNSTTKEHEVLVISILTQVYRGNLIDPNDKQVSLLKTCFKIVEILLSFFNDISSTVQQACARVLLDLNQFCLEEGKYSKEQKISVLFTPLISILRNGVDKASQSTATVCINELIKFWYSHNKGQYLDLVSKQIFQILLKINSEYQDIFNAIITLIEYKGIQFFENKLPNFMSKVLQIINGTREGPNNLNSYMCRVNVCKIVEKIAVLLSEDEKNRLADLNVIGSLQKAARNKIIQVQMAAIRAMKAWNGQSMPQQRNQKHSNSRGKPLKSLEQMRNQKKRQRSRSKQNTIKIQNQLNYMKQDLQKMVKGGWGANNRAKNYVKRGQGAGGGHYGQIQYSTPPKNTKSHRQHLEQLRDVIKKGAKQNKNIDKFDQITVGMKKYFQDQIPTTSNNNVNVFVQHNKTEEKKRDKQPEKKTSPQVKSLKINENGDEFQVEQDQGDQTVHIRPNLDRNKTNNQQLRKQIKNATISEQSAAQDYVIDQNEIDQLLRQQQSLKDYANKRQLGLSFEKGPNFPLSIQAPKVIQTKNVQIKPQGNQSKSQKRISNIKQTMNQLAPQISEEQLQQLMLENNLSEVSQNIDKYLNQSDYNIQQSKGARREQINLQNLQMIQVQKGNFTKKGTQSMKVDKKFDDSLNFTDSGVTKFKESANFKESMTSQQAKHQLKGQFTLNPHKNTQNANRFQSIHRGNQADEQIQEDLVESDYEQSYPNHQNMLPFKTKLSPPLEKEVKNPANKTSKNVFISSKIQKPKQEEQLVVSQQQMSINYQQLIQNPPRNQKQHLDKKSFIRKSPQKAQQSVSQNNENDQEDSAEVTQSVTDKWIRILSYVENGEVNQAFQQALSLDDPIYLMRLLIITRTPISSLTAENCASLWQKFLEIYKHNFISILFVQLFTQANELSLIKNSLTIEQMQELLLKLYEVSGTSKGKLSFNAALLYNNIDEDLRPSKKK